MDNESLIKERILKRRYFNFISSTCRWDDYKYHLRKLEKTLNDFVLGKNKDYKDLHESYEEDIRNLNDSCAKIYTNYLGIIDNYLENLRNCSDDAIKILYRGFSSEKKEKIEVKEFLTNLKKIILWNSEDTKLAKEKLEERRQRTEYWGKEENKKYLEKIENTS